MQLAGVCAVVEQRSEEIVEICEGGCAENAPKKGDNDESFRHIADIEEDSASFSFDFVK